jgi:hypothetical protein
MSDIFISYAREDELRAEVLAKTLASSGWSIFWDRKIPIGKTWRQTIGKALNDARCVIVIWSKTSIDSSFVQEEADDAKRRGILVPVLIEKVEPPIGFRSIQAAQLENWDGTESTPAFRRLIDDIAALIGPSPEPIVLPRQIHALLASVRIGLRLRYEFIKRFAIPATGLSDEQRRTWIREIPRTIDNILTESAGNITLDDLQSSLGEYEADRIGRIMSYWPGLKEHLYGALGISPDGTAISDQGLIGPNLEKYRLVFEALRLSNIEFVSRVCARISGIFIRPEEDLQNNAKIIDASVLALDR